MEKYTKGPWTIGDNYHEHDENRIDIRAPHNEFGDTKMLAIVRTTDTQKALADAKLICAAPKLLEKLTLILELGRKDLSNPKYDSYFKDAKQLIQQLK